MTPRDVLDSSKLLVCVGSGGVGKTSTAAAMGVWAARRGRKVMVLTIDPAKRLANSLGLQAFGNEGVRIDLPDAEGEPLGYERVGQIVAEAEAATPQDLIDALLQAAEEWAGSGPPNDDITFVALKAS